MSGLYLFSLVVGGGLLLVSMLGNVFGGDVDVVADADVDLDADVDGGFTKILSLRTATYFLFGFGGVGTALSWLWGGERSALAFGLALGSGAVLGGLASLVFRYLRASESGGQETEASFVGLLGTVTIPLSAHGVGKIQVQRGPRTVELIARPHGGAVAGVEEWKQVVIVEMERGMALVAPFSEELDAAAGGAAPSLEPGGDHVR